uniref:Putative ovule protein n=1 Tax=Solanum chacoense TaxID=4108 RepID=A0A0V0GY24_SOLCH
MSQDLLSTSDNLEDTTNHHSPLHRTCFLDRRQLQLGCHQIFFHSNFAELCWHFLHLHTPKIPFQPLVRAHHQDLAVE